MIESPIIPYSLFSYTMAKKLKQRRPLFTPLNKFLTSFILSFILVIGTAFAAPHVFEVFNGGESLEAEAYKDLLVEASSKVRPSCVDNYTTWGQQSYTPKTNNAWDLYFIPAGKFSSGSSHTPKIVENFMDLNGDGLPDYLYSLNEE